MGVIWGCPYGFDRHIVVKRCCALNEDMCPRCIPDTVGICKLPTNFVGRQHRTWTDPGISGL